MQYNITIDPNTLQLETFVGVDRIRLLEIFMAIREFHKCNEGLYVTAIMKINNYGFTINPN